MRPLSRLLSALLAAAPAVAQGVVNESLLRAPSGGAAETWSSRVFEQVQGSVVYVAVEVDGDRGAFVVERASSGIVVDGRGYVVTFHRLVQEAIGADDKRIKVRLNDASNTELAAKLVRSDAATGLALLRIEPPQDGLTVAPGVAGMPHYGEPVLVVARPAGEEMLAFAGVASRALSAVEFDGHRFARGASFLTDARVDLRCDGAGVFGADGALLGIYSSEHVAREVREPKLEDLKRPSFGAVIPAERIRGAFAAELGASEARARAPHAWARAVAAVAPSVVGVYSGDGEWPMPGPNDPGCEQRNEQLGSGVVATADGLVLCNAHVCRGDVRVKVGAAVYPAEVVKRRSGSNLALLRVALPTGVRLTPATFGVDDDVRLGEAVLAVGNPTGDGAVVTGGVISAMRAREGGRIQADANLGNQNGGGAMIDASGRVVGIGDAGRVDPVEMAYMMRRDRATKETNLSTFVGVRQVRKVFGDALDEASAEGSLVAPMPASEQQRQLRRAALATMVEQASGAMLNIYVARNIAEIDPEDPFPPDPVWQPMSLGSGVIIDRSGLAVSNWHVVDDGTFPDGATNDEFRITARGFGGKEYEVRVLSISREDDLSLLQLVLDDGESVQAVELGNSEQLGIGEAVAAIGNPHGRSNTITYGVVSAKGQGIRVKGRWAKLNHLIETDAAINGGNSGGALLDMNGRLVGINSAGGGSLNNVGYAIAVDHVRRQLTGLLMQPYKLRSPELGMRVLDDEGEVVVMDVDERGPAARAGVRSGDRVRALGGTKITWTPGFARTLLLQQAGVPVAVEVERQGEAKSFEVTPLRPEVWSVIRQAGLEVRDFGFGEAPERVQRVVVAMHRKFSGDATAVPQVIPSQVVRVERVFAAQQPEADLKAGDLVLGIELRTRADNRAVLQPIDGVRALRDWFNNREIGSYDGARWRCWVARGDDVRAVELVARRLLW
ncbi:MAG: trypsin-like peptidase domain-containing protein [Planctomycetota bacterium]